MPLKYVGSDLIEKEVLSSGETPSLTVSLISPAITSGSNGLIRFRTIEKNNLFTIDNDIPGAYYGFVPPITGIYQISCSSIIRPSSATEEYWFLTDQSSGSTPTAEPRNVVARKEATATSTLILGQTLTKVLTAGIVYNIFSTIASARSFSDCYRLSFNLISTNTDAIDADGQLIYSALTNTTESAFKTMLAGLIADGATRVCEEYAFTVSSLDNGGGSVYTRLRKIGKIKLESTSGTFSNVISFGGVGANLAEYSADGVSWSTFADFDVGSTKRLIFSASTKIYHQADLVLA